MEDGSPDFRADFAARLEAVRRSYGTARNRPRLSMAGFADALGISAARYRRYERAEIEPPLDVLATIRRLTGVSLDWLVADLPPGGDTQRSGRLVTIADRLRWARESQEPWADSCAAVMHISPERWLRYEHGTEPLPVEVATQFAHRFSVSLDFLYTGDLTAVAPGIRDVMTALHPELLDRDAAGPRLPTPELRSRTPIHDGNTVRSTTGDPGAGRRRHRREVVC